jgi:phosphoribosylaminoimidazole (AIR) synthetase
MIQTKGRVSDREMFRTFNMGIGFLVICPKRAAAQAKRILPAIRPVGHVTDVTTVTVEVDDRELEIESY